MALLDPIETGFQDDLHDEMLDRARALRPLLMKWAQTNEDRGEIAPEVIDALDKAEMLKMAVPRRWGGLCLSSHTMANVSRELAKGCPSTAWVVSIINSCVWIMSKMAPAMQELVFADGIPRMCGPSNGGGLVSKRDGKYFVTGKWAYGSASHHAEWAMVPASDEAGKIIMVLLPMSAVEIVETWNVAGMKGTGSDTLIVEDVEISEAQFCDVPSIANDNSAEKLSYKKEATDYWVNFPLLRAKAMGVMLGAAEGLLETVVESKDRPIIYTNYAKRGDSHVWQAGVGHAAARIGVARSIVDKHNRHNDDVASKHETLSFDDRALCRGECAIAADLLIQAAEDIMDLSGSSAFATKSPSQRYWRDFSIGIRHIIFNSKIGYEVYGQHVLGLEPTVAEPDWV